MKIIVVGTGAERLADLAAAPFRDKPGVELGFSPDVASALEIVGDEPDALVLLPVRGAGDPALAALASSPSAAPVIAVAASDAPLLRNAAFSAGARDVMLPPHESGRIEAAVEAALGRPIRRWRRISVPLKAIVLIAAKKGPPVEAGGTVINLSPGGAQLSMVRGAASHVVPARGALLQVSIGLPSPYRAVTVHSRVLASEPGEREGDVLVRMQFVGMSVEEIELVGSFLDSLDAVVEDFARQLRSLQKLDLRLLRTGYVKGVKLPALLPREEKWLFADLGTPESDLAPVVLARVRANMVSNLFQSYFAAGEESTPGIPPFKQWRGELLMASAMLRQETSRRMSAGETDAVRELKDLEARIHGSVDQIERLAERVTGQKRESKVGKVRDQELQGEEAREREDLDAALVEASEAAPRSAEMEKRFLRIPGTRGERRNALMLVALMTFGMIFVSGERERHTVYPSWVANADHGATVRGIRLRSTYEDKADGVWIAIVDGSWWNIDDQERWRTTREIATRLAIPQGRILEVHDYAGDKLAIWMVGPTPNDAPADPFRHEGVPDPFHNGQLRGAYAQ